MTSGISHARRTAADTHTPPAEFAKTVLLSIDDRYAIAVLPATHQVAPSVLTRALGADHVRLASESEMESVFKGCQLGAAPPFG